MRKTLWVVALVLGVVLLHASDASATQPPSHKVVICHAKPADTAANGWVRITVDVASVGYQHSGHQSEHDADIIPPWQYGQTVYPGKNWDNVGQAVWRNGCKLPVVTTTTTTTVVQDTTTTTVADEPTTTTTVPDTTTSTVPVSVPERSTTTVPAAVTTTTDVGTPTVVVGPANPAAPTGGELPRTGGNTWLLAALAAFLIALGLAMRSRARQGI